MELKILLEEKKPLLNRTEYKFKLVTEEVTPSRIVIRDLISKNLKVKPELVVVSNVYSQYGQNNVIINARVYDSEDVLLALERKNLVEKHRPPQEA